MLRTGNFTAVYIVVNADKFKYFERWASANDFPPENIINDGTTTFETRLGALGDFDLALRSKGITAEDVMVVAGDVLFQVNFDVSGVLRFFRQKGGELQTFYQMGADECVSSRGIIEMNAQTREITNFLEKPSAPSMTRSRLGSIVFSCFRHQSFAFMRQYLEGHPLPAERAFGLYMQWLVGRTPVYGMKIPGGFQLIGGVGLADYEEWTRAFSASSRREGAGSSEACPIVTRSYARVGLVGNPSDGFFGKTIALSICNYWAQVGYAIILLLVPLECSFTYLPTYLPTFLPTY